MTTCDNPEHSNLEAELNDALEEVLQMEERLAAYEAAGVSLDDPQDHVVAVARAEDLAALQERVGILEKERDAYEQDYLNQKDRVNELEAQIEDNDRKTKDLERLRRKLEEDIDYTRKLLQTEKARAADAQKRAGGADRTRRSEQREQIALLQELQELRERAEELEAQVGERDEMLEALVLSNHSQLKRNETLTVQNEDLRGEFSEATQMLEEKARDLLECQEQLEVAKDAEEEHKRRLEGALTEGQRRSQELEEALRVEKGIVAQLKEQAAGIEDGGGSAARQELERFRSEVERLGRELGSQSSLFEQAALDLEVLTTELGTERQKNRDLAHEIQTAEVHKVKGLETKLRNLIAELEAERQRYGELEDSKGKLEKDLAEAEDWKSRYEQGHGLVEAVRFQKQLKNDISRLEAELEDRTVKLGEAMDANEVLSVTCQRLKREAGRPEDFEFDDLPAVKKAQADEVKRLMAVSTELQEQVDDLNDERVRLLRKLRDRAAGSVAVVGSGPGGIAGHEGEGARVKSTGRGQGIGSVEQQDGDKSIHVRVTDEALPPGAVESESAEAPGIVPQLSPGSPFQPGEETPELENGSPKSAIASAARDASRPGAGTANPGEVGDGELPIPAGKGGTGDAKDPSGQGAADPAAEELKGGRDDGLHTEERRTTPISTSSGKGGIGCVHQANDACGDGGAGATAARDGEDPRGCAPGGSSASREDGTGRADGTGEASSFSDLGAKRRQVRDDKVEQLTRINETLMRQLHELMARKDGGLRDSSGRRSLRGGTGSPRAGVRAPPPQVQFNSEMQCLLTEVGNLREMIALGIDSKAPRTSSATGDNESRVQQGLLPLGRADPDASSGGVAAKQGTRTPSPGCDSGVPLDKASGSPSRTPIDESQPLKGAGSLAQEKDEVRRRQFRRLNLLPEQWTTGVRDMNLRLVEALEQLRSQEEELDEHEKVVARYEAQISEVRAQAAALYREQEGKEKVLEEKRKAFAEETEGLREERDALAVRVRRLEEVLAVEDKAVEDPSALNGALRELSRKVTVYEVNEVVMARRYASLKEQLQLESEARAVCEKDLMEMSAMTKIRLLYLGQWKAAASARLTRLHRRIAASVPEHELICTRRELEELQEEYLGLLQSCAEARVQVVEMSELSARIQRLDGELAEAKVEIAVFGEQLRQAEVRVHKAEGLAKTAEIEAGNQVKAAAGGATQADFSALLAEVQKHQGDSSKAEVDRAAAVRRSEIAERRLSSVETECRTAKEKAASLESREREARLKAQAASAELVKVQNRFEGGLTREEVRALRERLEVETERAQAAALDAERLKEVADIASEQAMAMANQRKDAEEEIAELRKAVADLESRSDDDRLIGQLQRKLMATKMTYRALARKHEMTKADLRRKVTQLRVLEMRMDKREDALYDLHERSREKVAALREALVAFTEGRAGGAVAGADGAAGPERGLSITRARELAAKIAELTAALETSERALREAGEARRDAEMKAEAAEVSHRSQEALVGDLKQILLPAGSKIAPVGSSTGIATDVDAEREGMDVGEDGPTRSHGAVGDGIAGMTLSSAFPPAPTARDMARRVIFLSEELCAAKLEASELRRNVASLREDKEYMQRRVANVESSSRALEVAKAEAETRAVLACGEVGQGCTEVDTGGVGGVGDVGDGDAYPMRTHMEPGSASRATSGCDEAAGGELSGEEQRLLYMATLPAEVDFGGLDPEEALRRLQGVQAKVASLTRALVGAREEKNAALARVEGAEHLSKDLQRMLRFYEKQAAQNGLPCLDDHRRVGDGIGNGPPHGGGGGGRENNDEDGGAKGSGARGQSIRPRNSDLERDRASMQEAANTTMASMKRLLEDKNAAIERLKRKLENARAAGREAASADRSEAARLTDRIYRENEDSLGQLRVALRQLGTAEGLGGGDVAMNNRLMTQLEEVSGLLGEKDETIRQLELKLRTASNQRERAEERCGEALEENERMRVDLSTLASQLQQAEERCLAAMEDRSSAKRLAELRKALLAKEKKMRDLREALVKLKQEFAQAEMDREGAAAEADRERARKSDDRSKGLEGKLKKLREQLGALQEGMARAARDLEHEKKEREELTKSHEKALVENRRLREESRKTQERAAFLEATLADTRRDLDNAKEEEQEQPRARSKPSVSAKKTHRKRRREGDGDGGERRGEGKESFLSDSEGDGDSKEAGAAESGEGKSGEGPPGGDGDREHGEGGEASRAGLHGRIGELEKRIQVLTAQNAALRSIVPPPSPGPGNASSFKNSASRRISGPGRRLGTAADYRGEVEGLARPRGDRHIGSGPGGSNNPSEQHRAALSSAPAGTIASSQVRNDKATQNQLQGHREVAHRSWESEKKLRKRVETLERRLDERGVELRAAENQITQIRDMLTRANKEREAAIKRLNESGLGNPVKKGRVTNAEGLLQAEDARARVFGLEQENASLRRAVEVELPAEIDSLKHQVRALGEQLEESESRRLEQERKAGVIAARALRKSGGGGVVGDGALREEEALFHDLEAVRDELSAEKGARRDLEAQLLERDAANMELRFDLEARSAETERLQRRAKELQVVIKASGSSGGVGKGPGQRTPGSRLKRERDLEEVVEALKRVTEKLRAENERLRKGAAEGAGRAEAERVARGAKRDAVALREEMERLRSRVRQADDSVHRLAQKEDLVNQLRRKLKAKVEDLRSCQEMRDELAETKTRLVAELDEANERLAATASSERLRMSSSPTPSVLAEARDEVNALREQVEDQADLIDHLREQLAAASTSAAAADPAEPDDVDHEPALNERSDEVVDAIAAAKAAQAEAEQLRRRLAENERELQRMERRATAAAIGTDKDQGAGKSGEISVHPPGGSGDDVPREVEAERLDAENLRLREENEKLLGELQAFDLDFFEEIEDLKYKYSEAVKKLRRYEGGNAG